MSQPITERTDLPKHPDSFLALEELGNFVRQYIPTFLPAGQYINDTHRRLSQTKVENGMVRLKDKKWFGQTIPGWLSRADALKLYELAYFAERDVLEFGAYNGLSTYLLALALRDRTTSRKVFSVDLNADYLAITSDHLNRGKLLEYVKTVCARAPTAMRQLTKDGHLFDFVFVNHSHTFSDISDVCNALNGFLAPGGFVFFHDYNDARNRQDDPDFEVYQAVNALLDGDPSYTLHGVYGRGALVRRSPDNYPASNSTWQLTAEAINALPEPLRGYIHWLETHVDPAVTKRENIILRAERDALAEKLARLEKGQGTP